MSAIFISYRRSDIPDLIRDLGNELTKRFGKRNVFWDRESIKGGERYERSILAALNGCKVFIALIGTEWVSITEAKKLAGEKDYARWETATALQRSSVASQTPIRVIPVLVRGASLPRPEDLPEDLQDLLNHHVHELRPQHWKEDLATLIPVIEADLKTDYSYSLLGGSIAGLISGTIVGILYYLVNRVEWWRIILVGLYGLLAGATLSFFINAGITKFSKWLNYSPYSKVIGGTVGGACGGILAGIVAGFGFSFLEGKPVTPIQVAFAVAVSTVFITLGTHWPDMTKKWDERIITIITLIVVTAAILFITRWLLEVPLGNVQQDLQSDSPTNRGVMILGLVCGIMSGLQAGMTLFVYDHFKKS